MGSGVIALVIPAHEPESIEPYLPYTLDSRSKGHLIVPGLMDKNIQLNILSHTNAFIIS